MIENPQKRETLLIDEKLSPITGLTSTQKKSNATPQNSIEHALGSYYGKETASTRIDLDLSKYQPYIGDVNVTADIDEARARSQSIGQQTAYGLGRLVGTTATKFLEGLGYASTALPALFTGDADVMLDNAFSELWNNIEEGTKERLPIYHTNKYKQGNIFEQMGTYSFYMDDVVDGIAFMTSAILGSKGINLLGKGLGTYSKLAKAFSRSSKALKAGKVVGLKSMNLTKMVNNLDIATMSLYNSVAEAAFEAKDLKDSLIGQGLGASAASESAMNGFWSNVMVLMGPNMLTNSLIFKPFKPTKGAISSVYKNGRLVKESLKDLTFADQAGIFAKKATMSMASEGLWEENIQLAIQNYETSLALGEDDRPRLIGLAEEWVNNFTTDEGQKAMMLGAIIGLLSGGIGGVKEARGEKKQQQYKQQMMGATLQAYQDRIKDFVIKDEEGKPIIDPETGKEQFDLGAMQDAFEAHLRSLSNVAHATVALETGNETMYKFLTEQKLASLALAYMDDPDGAEHFKNELTVLANQEVEVLDEIGNYENKESVKELKSKYLQRADQYSDMYSSIVNNYTAFLDFGDSDIARKTKQSIVNSLFLEGANQNFWVEQRNEVESKISKYETDNLADSDINKKEVKRLEKERDGINGLIQESEANFRRLADVKEQKAYYESQVEINKRDLGLIPPEVQIPVKDSKGNEMVYEGKEKGDLLHTIVDEKGEPRKLTDSEIKELGLKDLSGNYIVEPDVIVDEEGNEYILDGKEGKDYRVLDAETGEVGLVTPAELREYNFKKGVGSVEEEIVRKEKERVDRLAKNREEFKELLNSEDGADVKEEFDRALADEIGTKKYDNFKFHEIFDKAGTTGAIPSVYRGEVGDLFRRGDKVIFQAIGSDTRVEFDINTKLTLGDHAISIFKNFVFDIVLTGDTQLGPGFLVNGTFLTNRFRNPLKAVREDKDGNPIAIVLWKGNSRVLIKNPVIVNDLALAIAMMEKVRTTTLDYMKESKESFVMVKDPKSKYGKEYAVYNKNGKWIVSDRLNGKPYNDYISARVLDTFYKSLDERISKFNEVLDERNTENLKITREDIQNELREYDNIIRQATPGEINESKSAAEIQDTEEEPEERSKISNERTVAKDSTIEVEARNIDKRRKEEINSKFDKQQLGFFKDGFSAVVGGRQPYFNFDQDYAIQKYNEFKAIHAKYDKELDALTSSKEEKAGKKVEQEIIDSKAEEMAEEKTNAEMRADAREGQKEADIAIEAVNDSEIPKDYQRVEDKAKKEGVNPANSIAYNYKYNPTFDKWIANKDTRLSDYTAHLSIAYDVNDYVKDWWAKRPGLFAALKDKKLSENAIDTILYIKRSDQFDNETDIIPIVVELRDKDGNLAPGEPVFLHTTDFVSSGARDRTKAEREAVRTMRSKVLRLALKGDNPIITKLSKTSGRANNTTTNKLITDVFPIKSSEIRLGISDGHGYILRGDGTDMKGKASGTGNVYLETNHTPNGEINTVKLNTEKISKEHSAILLNALIQAYTGTGGYSSLYKGDAVSTGLTVGEVIRYLALEGKQYTSQLRREDPKPYLIPKQLWVEDKIIYYGENGEFDISKYIQLAKSSKPEDVKVSKQMVRDFIKWSNTHKNYAIIKNELGRPMNKSFRIGSLQAVKGESYDSFLVKHGLVKTDLDAELPFHSVVTMFDTTTLSGRDSVVQPTTAQPAPIATPVGDEVVEYKETEILNPTQFASLPTGTIIYNIEEDVDDGTKEQVNYFRIREDGGIRKLEVISENEYYKKKYKDFNNVRVDNAGVLAELVENFMYKAPLQANIPVRAAQKKEESPKPKVVKGKKLVDPADYFDNNKYNRLVPTDLQAYKPINLEKELKWLRKKLPKELVKIVDELIKVGGNQAYGQLTRDVMILSKVAAEGTVYHEAFHRVTSSILTKEQRDSLYKDAKEKYGLELKTDKAVEEYLADRFMEYVIAKDKNSVLKKLTDKIKNFFLRLYDFIFGIRELDSLDVQKAFRLIESGRLKYEPFNFDSNVFNDTIGLLKNKLGLSSTRISGIVKTLTYMLFQTNSVSTIEDVVNIDYQATFKQLEKMHAAMVEVDDSIADNYKMIIDNSMYFKDLVDSYLRSMKISKKELSDPLKNEYESDGSQSDFERLGLSAYESDFKDNMLSSIKMLVMTLKSTEERDPFLRYHQFVDFNSEWNRIMSDLHDADTIEEMLLRLDQRGDDNTAYKELSTKLKQGGEVLRTQFEVSVRKAKHKFIDLTYTLDAGGKPSFQFQNTDVQRATKNFVKEWSDLLYSSDFFVKDVLQEAKVQEAFDTYEELASRVKLDYDRIGAVKDLPQAMAETVKLLNSISIPIDHKVLSYALATRKSEVDTLDARLKDFLIQDIKHLFGATSILKKRLSGTVLNTRGDKIKDTELYTDEKTVEALASLYIISKPEEMTVTVLGPEGNPYFVYTPNNYVTDTFRKFKKDKDSIKKLLDTVTNKSSYILNQLYNNDEARQGFDINTFSGFIQKSSGDVGRDYLKLNRAEDLLFKISAVHSGYKGKGSKKGLLPMPTLADRKTYYLYRGLDLLNYEFNVTNGKMEIPDDSEVINLFVQYAEDEKARIKEAKAQIDYAVQSKNSSGLIENFHYKLMTENKARPFMKGKGKWEVVDKDLVKVFADSKGNYMGNGTRYQHFKVFNSEDNKGLRKEVISSIDNIIDDTIKYAAELGIIEIKYDKNGRPVPTDNKLLDDALVSKVATEEFGGNEGFAIKKILANYTVNIMMSNIETQKMLSGDISFYKGQTAKELSEDFIKRLSVLTSTGDNLRTVFPEEHELSGKTDYTVASLNTSEIRSSYMEGLVKRHMAVYRKEAEDNGEEVNEKKLERSVRYKLYKLGQVDQTDAQVYISPTMYRSLMIRLGEWSDKKQQAFDLLESDIEPNALEEKMALNLLMPPQKFVHFGLYNKGNMAAPIFDKMSMATLFKRIVKDTNLEELYNRMELKGKYEGSDMAKLDMVKFDTAVKVGNAERFNYYTDKDVTKVRDLQENPLTVGKQKFEYLRRQLLTDPHDVNETLLGTQVKKLAMSNIDKKANYILDGKNISGAKLIRQWTEILKLLSNRGKDSLLKGLGVEIDAKEGALKITDATKLISRLREDAIKSGMPDNIIDMLKVDENNKLFVTLDALPERKWIYSRLISMVNRATIDVEMPGNAFIQMTNFGFDKMTDAEIDSKRDDIEWLDEDTGNTHRRPLRFYEPNDEGGIDPMECMVSVNLFKNVIPNYNNLTWKEKKAWVKKNPEIMGYRIPTQGLNSISMLKVVGLLPEQMGDTIVLPAEFTALTGSDFDIDKLYVARYSYNKEGKKVKYREDGVNSEKALNNRLLEIYRSVITSPLHITQSTTPLDASTELIKKVYKEIIEITGEKSRTTASLWESSPRYQADVKDKYTGGKGGIGPFALANAHHVLGQIAEIALKKNIGIGNVKQTDEGLFTALDGEKDVNGEYILDWLSALINAHVDIAKDPYIFDLNVNNKTYGMTNLLVRAGVGELAFWFLPQPVLKDLASEDALQKGRIRSKRGSAGIIVRNRWKDLYEEALRKEGKEFKDAGAYEKDEATFLTDEQIVFSDVWDKDRLRKDIDSRTVKDSDYYFRQLQILDEFQYLNKQANFLNDVVMSSRVDTKQYGSNMSEIKGYETRYKKVFEDQAIYNLDALFSDTFLDTLFENSVVLSKQLFGQLTVTGTDAFQDVVDRVIELTGNKYTVDNKLINFIADELFSVIASKFFTNHPEIKATTAKVKNLFFGDNNIVKQVAKVKAGKLYPELVNNRFIMLLKTETENGENVPDKLTLHSTNIKEKWDRDDLVRAWEDLLDHENEDIRRLGRNIVMYSFYSSGFNKTLTSFYNFIPNSWLKDIGYADHMEQALNSLLKNDDKGAALLHEAVDEMFLNNWTRTKLTNKLNTKDLVPWMDSGVATHSLKTPGAPRRILFQIPAKHGTNSEHYIGTNDRGEPIYSPYVLDPSGYLYKYVGYDSKNKNGVYKLIPTKKGYYDKGFTVKEYFLDDSILITNKYIIGNEHLENAEKILDGELKMSNADFYRNVVRMETKDLILRNENKDPNQISSTNVPNNITGPNGVVLDILREMLTKEDMQGLTNEDIAEKLQREDGLQISAAEIGSMRPKSLMNPQNTKAESPFASDESIFERGINVALSTEISKEELDALRKKYEDKNCKIR